MPNPPTEELGFRPIGSLTLPSGHTPKATASTPMSSARSSETTGSVSLARGAESATGRQPSETAASKSLAPREAATAVTSAPDERASRAAVMGLLRRLSGSCAVVAWTFREGYGADGQFNAEIVGVRGLPTDRAALLAIRDALAPICQPASADPKAERLIVSELARTLAVTVGQRRQGADDDVALDTMADELMRFPVDCVLRTLGSWRRNDKWRPALAELLSDIRWRAAPRMAAMASVVAALDAAGAQGDRGRAAA